MQCTLLGCNNRQMSLGVGHSESVTVNQPCKPSNIEPKAVTTPSLRIPVNKSSLTDRQQQKEVTRKDNLMKTLSATTAKNYPMRLNKPFTTPMGKPKPFTPPLVRTKPNSPATPPTVCFNGGGVTPPLCQCGRRTRRRSVVNPGPNQGRAFFACSLNHGRSGLGANANNKTSKSGCGFFRWEIHL
ncbi:ERI1 exoribonuclease 2 [Desmophyllum pertusum]|uniref:ERI1 exoribonuclease 2 n=1 Tax=Desmophyllum pertusum TaxID=174260 RepID=A0A9W9YPZ9_9CNID|nr:ERI1 exoribonuclease 2 [Desmophyllum pertusum]